MPQGYKVRRKGEDFWRTDETEAAADDEIQPADETPVASSGDYTVEPGNIDQAHTFQKKRAQLGDFAKKQALDAVKKIASNQDAQRSNQRAAAAAGGGITAFIPANFSETERKIQSSSPDKVAAIVQDLAERHGQGTDLDALLTPVEDAVQNYKRLTIQQQPQVAQQIQGQLEAQDLPGKQARAQQIDKEIAQAQKDLQIAASPRQAKKIQDNIQFLNDQKRQLGNLTPPAPEEQPNPTLNLQGNIDTNIKASGGDPKQFRQALVAGAQKLEQVTGVDTANLKDPVPFSRALLTGLQIFDPGGTILGQLQQDLQPNATGGSDSGSAKPAGPDAATARTADEDLHTQNLKNLRDQRRQLYQELGQTPELNNWLGVLSFIFLSVITRSPAAAASILGISRRQGNLKQQLDLIEQEMHEEAASLKESQHEGDIQRKMAAENALRKQNKADDYKRELMKMYLQHHMILLREAQRHPAGGDAYKRLDKDFARYASMESASHSEMQRADKDRNDPYADDAHKAQAEKDYSKALKDYNFWKQKRAMLNATIEGMGGTGGPEESEEPQQ